MHMRPSSEYHVCDDLLHQKCSFERLGTGKHADVAPGRLGGNDDNFGPRAVQILSRIHGHTKQSLRRSWLA